MAGLKGKTGIVTGGSSGIGFQIANVLAQAGATVYVISRTGKPNFGLGLSVAKELARLHHADLTVTDTPGGGAKFAVTFAARIS